MQITAASPVPHAPGRGRAEHAGAGEVPHISWEAGKRQHWEPQQQGRTAPPGGAEPLPNPHPPSITKVTAGNRPVS